MSDPAAEPSDALRKQLESDAGPHATPDQERAAEKRRDAANVGRTSVPEERHAPETETAAPVKRATKRAKKKA